MIAHVLALPAVVGLTALACIYGVMACDDATIVRRLSRVWLGLSSAAGGVALWLAVYG